MKEKLLRKVGAGLLGLGILLGAYGMLPAKKAAAEEKKPLNFTVTQEQDDDQVRVFLKNESDKVFKAGKVKVSGNKRLSFFSNEEVTVAPGDKMPIHVRVKVKIPAEATEAPEVSEKPKEDGVVKTGQRGIVPAVALVLIAGGTALLFVTSSQKNRKRMTGLVLIAAVSLPFGLKVLQAEDAVSYEFKEVITLEGVSEEVLFTVSFYPVEAGQHDEAYDASSVSQSEEVPYKTRYIAVDAYDGVKTVKQKGKNALHRRTTYKDDKYPAEDSYTGGQDEIIGVGNWKKNVEKTPYKTIYEADPDTLYGSEDRVKKAGVEGEKVKVYAFPVNPDTGEVDYKAEGNLVHEESSEAQDAVIVRAVGAEEKTEIPYQTIKKDDLTKPQDYEKVTQKGEKGYDLTRGLYSMDAEGKVDTSAMAEVSGTEHKDPVDEVIVRGVEWRETQENEEIPFETQTEYFIDKETADSWTSSADLLEAIEEFDEIAQGYHAGDENPELLDDEGHYVMYYKQRGVNGVRTHTHAEAYNKEGTKVGEREPSSEITTPVKNAVIVRRGFSSYSSEQKKSTNKKYLADPELAFEEQSEKIVEKDVFYNVSFDFDEGATVKQLLHSQGRTDVYVGNLKLKGEPEVIPFDLERIDFVYFDDEFDPEKFGDGLYEGLVFTAEEESGASYNYLIKKKGLEGSRANFARYDVDPESGTLSYRDEIVQTTEAQTEERYWLSPSDKSYYIQHNIEKQIRAIEHEWAKEAVSYINAYRAENGLSEMLPDPDTPEGFERIHLGSIVARRVSVNMPADEIGSAEVKLQFHPNENIETRSEAELFFDEMKEKHNDWLLAPDDEFRAAYIGAASKAGGRSHREYSYWIADLNLYSKMNKVDEARYMVEGILFPL